MPSSIAIPSSSFKGTLSDKESGALSAYNKDMKALVKATKKMSGYDKDTYYLLMVPRSSNSTLSGYMPVNSNIGFIFTEACNSQDAINRAIAHELGHGAFHLWHTFSNENKYVASQGSTNNLMDYSNNATSTDLYKYQWDFIHNPEFVLFRGDDEEGKFSENDAVVAEILNTIHNSNDKQESHCTIENKGVGFETHKYPLGDKTIDINIVKHVFEDLAINCNRASCAVEKCDYAFEKEGAFIKFIFTTFTGNENTDALEILVEEEYADELANWLFADTWEYLKTKDELTPKQIAIARDAISKVEDETKRGEMYLELQKKVPYHNQRDNLVAPEVTCNLTSVAMAFEMLGVSKEDFLDAIEKSEINNIKVILTDEEKNRDFEDVLELIRNKAKFDRRTWCSSWSQLANVLDISSTTLWVESSKKANAKISDIKKYLKEGRSIVISLFNYKGHIVRLQNIDENGITIDDPYGELQNLAVRDLGNTQYGTLKQGYKDHKNGENNSTNNGKDNLITWDDLDIAKYTTRGGSIESESQDKFKVSSEDIDEITFDKWWKDYGLVGKSEYSTRQVKTEKKDEKGNIIKDKEGKVEYEERAYYKSQGAVIKMYMIFDKK